MTITKYMVVGAVALALFVSVTPTGVLAASGSGGGGGGSTTAPIAGQIKSASATPSTIAPGASSTITWEAKSVASCSLLSPTNTVLASQTASSGTVKASVVVTPSTSQSQTLTYTIFCKDTMGAGVSKSIKISVVYPPACTLTANKASYLTGEMIQFSWTKTNTDSLVWKQPAVALGNLVYPLGNLLPAQGAVIPASPVGTHTATLVATNSLGSSSCYTTVVVADPITSGTINDAVSITVFPNLNGTALYTPTVDVSVLDADGVEVYAASLIPVTANTWTHDVSDQIAVGTYTTKLYDEKHKFLDEGVLTVDPEAPEILRVVGEYGALNTISHIAKPTSIYVEPNTHAQVIALISYEPVNWTLNLKRGSNVKRVIVTGYYTSTVTITGAPEYANVPVDETYNGGMHYWTYQPYVGITEDAAVRGLLKNMTGLDIYSWYFQYQATGFNVPGY